MTVDSLLHDFAAQGEMAGAAAVANVADQLAERIAATFPDIAVTAGEAAVLLTAPGLVARAFGTRRRAADPRLSNVAAIVSGGGG